MDQTRVWWVAPREISSPFPSIIFLFPSILLSHDLVPLFLFPFHVLEGAGGMRPWRQGGLDSAGPWGRRRRTGRHGTAAPIDSGWREVIAGAGESHRREG